MVSFRGFYGCRSMAGLRGATLEFSWSSGREPIVMALDSLCTKWVSVENFSLSGADLLVIDTFVLFLLVLLLDGIKNAFMLLRGK